MTAEDYGDFRRRWVTSMTPPPAAPFLGFCSVCQRNGQLLWWRTVPRQTVRRGTCLDPVDCAETCRKRAAGEYVDEDAEADT